MSTVSHSALEPVPASTRSGWKNVMAIAMLTNPGAAIGVIAPTIIDGFIRRGISLSTASLLGAAELAGLTAALLGSPLILNRYDRRVLAAIALTFALCGQLLTLFMNAPSGLVPLRLLAGLGEGGMYAVAIASLAATQSPDRAFGVVVTMNQISATVLLAVIAWCNRSHPKESAIVVLLGLIVVTGLFIGKLPSRTAAAQTARSPEALLPSKLGLAPAVLGLLGTFLLACGFGAVWPLIGQIAASHNASDQTIATAFSWAGVGGILAGMIATTLGLKLGRRFPLIVASTGFAISLIAPTYLGSLVAITLSLMFFWTLNIPYYMGLLAELDRTGRLAALTGAMIPFGIAAGQSISGPIAAVAGFRAISFMGATCVALALATILIAIQRQIQSSASNAGAAS